MSTDVSEYDAIATVLGLYVTGARGGDAGLMSQAFHPAAVIHGYFQGGLISGPIDLLFSWVKTNPPASRLRSQIAEITVSGPAATARLELADWNGVRFTDLFALLKTDGSWRIIAKVFDAHEHGQ